MCVTPIDILTPPLPGGRYIRLLELLPGTGNDPLRGHLRSVSLDHLPEYEALSYVWGQALAFGTITLENGGRLELGENLTDALHSFRHEQQVRTLWADALCIDQHSVSDRSEQVALMAEIYTRSQSVIVWLGQPTEHSHLGMEILSYLAGTGKIVDDDAPWNRLGSSKVQAALRDILGRPYFERLWVVQEAVLAQRITIRAGDLSLEWSSGAATRWFLSRIKLAEISPSWQQSKLRDIDFQPMRELLEQNVAIEARRNGTVQVPTLLDVVHSVRERKAADPRDRIYGVMSLVTPGEVAGFVPDYTESWEETYRRFYDLAERRVLNDQAATLEDIRTT